MASPPAEFRGLILALIDPVQVVSALCESYFCWLSPALIHAQEYDLLLRGGHVIDPKNKIDGRRDVAIKDGRIAAVAAGIPETKAVKTVNVSGLYVTPGLVDLHVHVFAGTGTAYTGPSSVRPDDHSFRSGVTTMVDAGSSGWRNFEEFKQLIIDKARTRVLAMLNIVGAGMSGAPEQNLQDMDPDKAAAMAAKHKDIIVGFKSAHYAGPEWTSVENAVKAGESPACRSWWTLDNSGRNAPSKTW